MDRFHWYTSRPGVVDSSRLAFRKFSLAKARLPSPINSPFTWGRPLSRAGSSREAVRYSTSTPRRSSSRHTGRNTGQYRLSSEKITRGVFSA